MAMKKKSGMSAMKKSMSKSVFSGNQMSGRKKHRTGKKPSMKKC